MDLHQMIRHAVTQSKFYQSKYKHYINLIDQAESFDLLKIMPKTTKDELIFNSKYIIQSPYDMINSSDVQLVSTSGSSGQMIEVKWLRNEYYKSTLSIWRKRKEWYNITPLSKCVNFNGGLYLGSRLSDVDNICYYHNNKWLLLDKNIINEQKAKIYYQEIIKFNPEWLFAQPSTLLHIVLIWKKMGLSPPVSIRYIELNGELLNNIVRSIIHEYFPHVKIANLYGANEVGGIAFECPYGHMHVLEDNVAVYIENSTPNESDVEYSGEIYVTSLHNSISPIINYSLGDRVKYKHFIDCPCKDKSNIIEVVLGRINEEIILSTGERISLYLFGHIIEKVNKYYNTAIINYKIIDIGNDTIEIYLMVKEQYISWKEIIIKQLMDEIFASTIKNIDKLKVYVFVDNKYFDFDNNKYKIFERKHQNCTKERC